jgi:hypothetical protein
VQVVCTPLEQSIWLSWCLRACLLHDLLRLNLVYSAFAYSNLKVKFHNGKPAGTRKLIANLVAMRSLQHLPARQACDLWLLYRTTILCGFIYVVD